MSSDSPVPDDAHAPLAQETGADVLRLQAFTTEWARCQTSVRAYLASFLSDPALLDDCVQEVALVAWKKGPLEEGGSAFLGHTLATARLVGLATIRKKQNSRLLAFSPEVAQSLAETVAEQEHAEQEERAMRLAALRSCLDKLEAEPRKLLEIRYFQDGHEHLKTEAKRLGKSLDALYKKLERLRELLRNCVTRQLGPVE